MRGIEMSLDEISKRAGISKGAAVKAAKRLEEAGFIVVSRRKATSNGSEVWQKPNSNRLVIPGAPTWSVPEEAAGFDAPASAGGTCHIPALSVAKAV
jgi:hypothetical protein